jgi:branched-chain amino acid transport system ATP-binding protein
MSQAELVIQELKIGYGRIEVVHGLSLRAAPGRVTSLIGPNGAGKTTTIASILGLVPAWSGAITLDGRDLGRLPTHERIRRGIGVVPQGRRIFPTLSVIENLRIGASSRRGGWNDEGAIGRVLETFPALARMRERLGGSLSGGEQQMLAVGRALMAEPRLLLLDEPSMGLSPRMVEVIYGALAGLRDRGMTMLLAEQNARWALALSDEAYVLESGRVEESGLSAELRSSPRVQEIYFGA